MSNQEQCPSCGGYKSDSVLTLIDPKTGKEVKSATCGGIIMVIMIAFVVGQGIGFFIPTDFWIPFVILIIAIVLFLSYKIATTPTAAEKRATSHYKYHCNICGYNWEWHEGQPRPKVNVRPEFLAKIEAQRWKCIRCGNVNEGSQSSCSHCYAPKM